jgi:hypothetical protein
MLTDYIVQQNDKLILNNAKDNIRFTTAHTEATKEDWEQYVFNDTMQDKDEADEGRAVLTRGWNGGDTGNQALFYIDNASSKLLTSDIIFFGDCGREDLARLEPKYSQERQKTCWRIVFK